MVNLSIDPPPSPFRSSPKTRSLRWVAYPVVLALGLAGGFVAGRRTAPSAPAAPGASAPPAVATGPGGAPPPVTPTGAPPQAAAPAAAPAPAGQPGAPVAAAPGAPAAQVGAAASAAAPPSAPQGPLVRSVTVALKGPLEESITAALPASDRAWGEQLTQVVNRLLVWSLRISKDGRRGDRLEVVYELPSAQPVRADAAGDAGPVSKEPIVLALRYASQKLGRTLTAYRFKPEGSSFARYYTAAGDEVEDRLVDSPVDDYEQVTSLLRDGRKHKGVDFKTPVGTPVRAPFDGEVTRRNWHFSANGNCLELFDPHSRRKAIFLHLEAAPKEMQPGRKVKKGEVIARSGNSGHSTAPHLHYQLEAPDGRVLDPYAVLPTRKVKLEGPSRTAFDQERQRLDPMLVAGR